MKQMNTSQTLEQQSRLGSDPNPAPQRRYKPGQQQRRGRAPPCETTLAQAMHQRRGWNCYSICTEDEQIAHNAAKLAPRRGLKPINLDSYSRLITTTSGLMP